ncbi:Uncharacterized protein dnm_041320 [Desulfonema magnum]|uniref:Uncharacterized protein n=1 Tax=Desulfonema magnum TaxID=45655 RepID=A0A975GNL3_9BACT|nr:Uncharacterized protein dnm_041320 [Desulfonema magnum]
MIVSYDSSIFLPRRHKGTEAHEVYLCRLHVFVSLWLMIKNRQTKAFQNFIKF